MKKQNFIKGSLILIASAAIAKVMGAIFRIPLANMLGGVGMGYFSSAYGIFMTIYAVSVSGIPVATARFTAEYSAAAPEKIYAFRKTALYMCAMTGLVFSLLMSVLAYPFSVYVSNDPSTVLSAIAIAPSIFFGCVTAVSRGCFEGQKNMYPTAVSQVIEATVKLISGLILCNVVLKLNDTQLSQVIDTIYKIFPCYYIKSIPHEELRIPLAAAAAISGVTLSTIAGTVYVTAYNSNINKLYTKSKLCRREAFPIARKFAYAVLPIAAGSLVTNLTSLIDLTTITHSLEYAIEKYPDSFSQYTSPGITLKDLPNFFYGSFTGMAVTIFNLIPTFTNMFGKSALPSIAENCRSGNIAKLHDCIFRTVFTVAFIAVPCGIGISAISPQVLELLFPSRTAETEICILPLRLLGTGIIFLSISSVLFIILQGAGKGGIPLKIMLMGVAVKFVGNMTLISIPDINISGAALSTVLCYAVILIASLYETSVHTGCPSERICKLLLKITLCGVLCGITAFLVSDLLSPYFNCTVTVPLSVVSGAIIYIISTHLCGVLNKTTLKMLIC